MLFYRLYRLYLLYLYFAYEYTNKMKDDYIVYVQYNNTLSLNNTTHHLFMPM